MQLDLVLIALAYLLGSISSGLLLARWKGNVDLRRTGSGNIGATNVARAMGKAAGVIALIGDGVKGVIPVLLAQGWGSSVLITAAAALAAVLGHIFPWYTRFRGGRGVATALGVFIPTLPLPVLGGCIVWGVVVAVSRYVSAGSVLAALIVPILASTFSYSTPLVWAASIIGCLIIVKHRGNLQRLLQGTESKLF